MARAGKLLIVSLLVIVLSSLFSLSSTMAVGVGVAPKELDFNVCPGMSVTKVLYVVNTGDNETSYKVYVDGENHNLFDISPAGFSLAPQANKAVQITVSPPLLSVGDHAAYIYVAATNPSAQLEMGAGIKVTVHLHIASWPLYVAIGIIVLLIALAAFLAWRRRRY